VAGNGGLSHRAAHRGYGLVGVSVRLEHAFGFALHLYGERRISGRNVTCALTITVGVKMTVVAPGAVSRTAFLSIYGSGKLASDS